MGFSKSTMSTNIIRENNYSIFMSIKICATCKRELPATTEYFYKSKNHKDGLRYSCKECWSKKSREWRENNKEYIIEYRKKNYQYRDTREYQRKYREVNREKIRENHKEYMERLRESDYGPRLQFLKNIHRWVKRRINEPEVCTICNEKKYLELSNISGEYKKDVNDYWWLCIECHNLFDRINKTHIKN